MAGNVYTSLKMILLSGLGAAMLASPAQAYEPVLYPPEFFEQFAPQTALEMVQRVPGFTIRGSEDNERGFGQASLNILINGKRPSSKSQSGRDILRQITASTVERVEILDGTTLDIPGLTGDVVNVVTNGTALSGSWRKGFRFEEGTAPQWLDGALNLSGSRGDMTWTLGFDSGQFTFTEDGEETYADASGVIFEDRIERIRFDDERPQLNGTVGWDLGDGRALNLNGSIEKENEEFRIVEDSVAIAAPGFTGQTIFDSGEDVLEFEVGGDYAFPLGPGSLKLIGLYGYEDYTGRDVFQVFDQGGPAGVATFDEETLEKELIARGEYTWGAGAWQVSLEGARNTLDADVRANADPFVNTRVEEDRVQGALTHTRRVGRFDLQGSVGAEYSIIDVPTSDRESDGFFRPKGFVSASTKLSPLYTLSLRGERQVGQLDFGDFVDSVDLVDGRDNSGNAQLVPDQTWLGQLTLERSQPKGLSGTVTLEYAEIEDPIDQVRFADGSEGPGNLNSNARFYGVSGNFTWVLDEVLQGLRLEGNGAVIETEIEDQLTFETRRFNGGALWRYNLETRWDVANTDWALFGEIQRNARSLRFRFDQELDFIFDKPTVELGVEHKDIAGMTLRVFVQNVLDEGRDRETILYETDRFGPISRIETFERRRGPRLNVQLSGSF
jgi:hypothetical protein